MDYFSLVFLAIIVEAIITYCKEFFVKGNLHWEMLISIAIGVLTAIAYGVDVFSMVGMQSNVPLLGNILTGILVSRGSNYVCDLVKLIGTLKAKAA